MEKGQPRFAELLRLVPPVKPSLLSLLACPGCGRELKLRVRETKEGEIESGELECAACSSIFAILRGVPRFAAEPPLKQVKTTVRRFGYQWREFSESFEGYRFAFFDWMKPLSEGDFANRYVLDAGCGMGRFTDIAASLGAKAVVGADLSESVEVAQQFARRRANLHILQADLMCLPLRKPFDLVYSIGVLHHLPDGEEGFSSLLRHVRPGGLIHVWVYGREGNEWLLRWVDPVRRKVTSRLPLRLLRLLAASIALPLHAVLAIGYRRASGRDIGGGLPYAPYLSWLARFPFRHTHQVVFDHLAAPIAHYYRREEFASWFERAGLKDVLISSRNANSWRGTARVAF